MRIKNNLAACFFVIVIFSFMGAILTVYGSTLVDKAKGVIIVHRTLDWKAMYPFEEDGINTADENSGEEKTTLFQKINYKILHAVNTRKSKIESYATEKMLGYMYFIEAARKYDALINWNITPVSEYNNIIELSDGYFSGLVEKRDVTHSAQNTIELADFCNKNNIKFLYVSAPAKMCRYEDSDISGKLDFVNQNADEFFKILKSANVDYLDLRENLHNENMAHHAAFFKTDHHWRPETGLWAARHILELIRDKYKYDVEPSLLNPENFETVTYPKWFLGSQGKKMTLSRAEPEDFNLLYPKYPVSIRHEDIPSRIDVTGDFNIMYGMNLFKERDYYASSTYNAYPGGIMSSYYNNLANNKIKILLLKDSFGQVVIPFLLLGIAQLDVLDLREFTGSVQTYVQKNKPDLVITLYTIGMIGSKNENSSWTRNIFDLR